MVLILSIVAISEGLTKDIQPGKITDVEANCKGPRANTSKRVRWEKKLPIQQLSRFSKSSFIDQDHGRSYKWQPIFDHVMGLGELGSNRVYLRPSFLVANPPYIASLLRETSIFMPQAMEGLLGDVEDKLSKLIEINNSAYSAIIHAVKLLSSAVKRWLGRI
ncbi:hypothetical protein OIU78_000230 [Salix suchowensis]|nr:hypothetical protein OIU78_000230 [Salix suchowensis]